MYIIHTIYTRLHIIINTDYYICCKVLCKSLSMLSQVGYDI